MSSELPRTLPELYSHINKLLPKEIDFGEAKLHVDESSVSTYRKEEYWRMFHSSFLVKVRDYMAPDVVVDVGANVGFMTLRFARAFPDSTVIAVEPNPHLIGVIQRNCEENGLGNVKVVNAAVGDVVEDAVELQVNLAMSVDSRVKGLTGNFETVSVPQTTVDQILEDEGVTSGSVFVKVDTQGYEDKVLAGCRSLMGGDFNPLLLIEYAPWWIEQAGGDPDAFLEDLVGRYRVCENLDIDGYYTKPFDELLSRPIASADARAFAAYTRKLSRNRRGWCDLLITR